MGMEAQRKRVIPAYAGSQSPEAAWIRVRGNDHHTASTVYCHSRVHNTL